MFVPLDITALAYDSLRIYTSHFDVSVWELTGLLLVDFRRRFELCVVIHANAAQFLFDITSNLPLCGGSQRRMDGHSVEQQTVAMALAAATHHSAQRGWWREPNEASR